MRKKLRVAIILFAIIPVLMFFPACSKKMTETFKSTFSKYSIVIYIGIALVSSLIDIYFSPEQVTEATEEKVKLSLSLNELEQE